MKTKEIFSILILCGLLFGCGVSDAPTPNEEAVFSAEETEEREEEEGREITEKAEAAEDRQSTEEAVQSHEKTERIWQNIEQGENKIYVTADELQGNILGYSLIRMPPVPENDMYYERDLPYLLDEELVGKGIYVSDYLCETEVFLGNILKEVLTQRGKVSDENRPYFTEYALRQIEETEWETLDAEWKTDLWMYDRYCLPYPLSGGGGYRFFYWFSGDEEKTAGENINQAAVSLYVDNQGKICEMEITIHTVPKEENGIERGILEIGLLDDDIYGEPVILGGSPCREELVWDFERYFRRFMEPDEIYEQKNEGLLQSGNVVSSAEEVADIFLHVMETRGADVEKYAEQFGFETDFSDFAEADWDALEENWTAGEAYDCFFIDRIAYAGYAGFKYYFYPDFKAMGVDEAKMVVIGCNVSVEDGRIDYNAVDIFPITEKVCQEMKQKQEKGRTLIVEKGTALTGKEKVEIPVIDRPLQYIPISEFDVDAVAAAHSSRKEKGELWGFTDMAEAGAYLGEKFLQDFAEDQEDGWKADGQYDCFHVSSNEATGYLHLQYYFYPEKNGEKQTKAKIMVVDVFLSEEGIAKTEINELYEE